MPSYGGGTAGIIVSGQTKVVRPTIAVQATPDYSDGDCIGGLITIANFAAKPQGSGIITRIGLRSAINITVQTFLHVFDSNPTASTFTDNGAISIAAADQDKILKTFKIASANWTAPASGNTKYRVELLGADSASGLTLLQYQLTSGSSLYMALEADGTINFGATTDLAAIVAVENN